MGRNRVVSLLLAGLLLSMTVGMRVAHAEGTPLRVFTGSTAHWTDLIVALKKGYFAEEGLEVQPTYFTTGAAATESFLAGKGDVVLTCELASLGMWRRGSVVGISRQARLFERGIDAGVLLRCTADTIAVAPPFFATEAQIDSMAATLGAVIETVEA